MKEVKPYLKHILLECKFLLENLTDLNYEKFINDSVLKRAFVRSLEIIGEAAAHLPKKFREKYSKIPWKEIIGMRNKLIHEYFGVNYRIVWQTIIEEIPLLKEQIEEILEKEGWEINGR